MIANPPARLADAHSDFDFFSNLLSFYTITGNSLELCSGDGARTIASYRALIDGPLDVCEISSKHKPALMELDLRKITFDCSYRYVQDSKEKYQMVVVEGPQGTHKDWLGNMHAEHLGFIPSVTKIMEDHSLLVLYCNRRPYNRAVFGHHGCDKYDTYDYNLWMKMRKAFFNHSPQSIPYHVMLKTYTDKLEGAGFRVVNVFMQPCYSDVPELPPYGFRLGLELEKVGPTE